MTRPRPPPLPDRPDTRKAPYTSLPAADDVQGMPSASPPALPPRRRPSSQAHTAAAAPPPLPTRPAPAALKPFPVSRASDPLLASGAPGVAAEKEARYAEPKAPRRSRRRQWLLVGALVLLALVVIVAVCASVIPKHAHGSTAVADSANNGGHPLNVSDGGVDIGAPGSIAVFGNRSIDHFVMTTNRSIVVTRLDPIVNPGSVGAHVHRVHGSSAFSQNLTSATDMQALAQCSTTYVQDDKSAYWVGQLYYRYPNGSLVAIDATLSALYYFQKAPTGVPIYPFPDNYNIVAGDPNRRVYNSSNIAEQALTWRCYRNGDGADQHIPQFPENECSGGLVQIINFPNCWDGVYADDADYSTHVSYTTDGPNGYYCPDAFSKHIIGIQFETMYAVQNYPYNGKGNITWVLAMGDTTGLGVHGDFMNGWKADTLQAVLDDCRYMNATDEYTSPTMPENCPPLMKTIDINATITCRLQTQIVDEPVGALAPLANLPGCNAIWTGTGSKPACPDGTVSGGNLVLADPAAWVYDLPYVCNGTCPTIADNVTVAELQFVDD